MPTDAVVVLKDDHQKPRKFFDDLTTTGPNATVTKGKISKNIIEQLTIHTHLENEIMYPRCAPACPSSKAMFSTLTRSTTWADVVVMELVAVKPDAERFNA